MNGSSSNNVGGFLAVVTVGLSLAEVNHIVTIVAGLLAIGFTAHKWIDYVLRKKRQRKAETKTETANTSED